MADRPKRKVEFIESYWTGGETLVQSLSNNCYALPILRSRRYRMGLEVKWDD